MKVAIFNLKGGVGRTTTALNLLAAIARRGNRPWGIDLDAQAQLSAMFAVTPRRVEESMYACLASGVPLADVAQITRSGVVLCPGHHELVKLDAVMGKGLVALNALRSALEHPGVPDESVIIDCAPLLNVATLNALFACDVVLVPISAEYLALRAALDVDRALKSLEPVLKRRLPRRFVLTRFADGAPMADDVASKAVAALRAEELCAIRIREGVEVAQSPTLALDVFRHAVESAGAHDYEALLDELVAAGFRP